MGYASFLSDLLETGRVRVPAPAELREEELRAGDEVLRAFEAAYRLELPGTPPAFDPAAARWAALRFFRACQFAAFRDVPAEAVAEALSGGGPEPLPSAHYSVDLVLRLLPDLVRFARSAAEKDPLVEHLLRLGREWPLSSVGLAEVGPVGLGAVADHPALLALYVDRVIATRDVSRLADARVRDGVRRALGLHTELAPQLAAALAQETTA